MFNVAVVKTSLTMALLVEGSDITEACHCNLKAHWRRQYANVSNSEMEKNGDEDGGEQR